MINYIRHDEQFFATVKLLTGEEILGEVLVSEDPDTKQDMIFIQNPAKTKVIELEPDTEKASQKIAMALVQWMAFSDEDFYVIDEKSVISIAPMSKGAVMMYKRWVKKEILNEEDDVDEKEIPMNESMGLVSKVDDARKLLKKIYESPSWFK